MNRNIIFHIDVNSAYLSWEAAYRIRHLGQALDLRSIPSAVGGDMAKRHGIILAKSIPAKKYKIQTGEPVVDALRKCPELVLVPPDYELYEKNSKAFLEILRKYSPCVEQYSIDEAFMDMTGMEALFGSPVIAAGRIKDEIFQTLGFTVNIGVSTNKLLAKMAGDFRKPDRVHTLFPEEIEKKLWPLPVRDLFFVGGASEKKLYTLGIRTVGELARTDIEILRPVLKKHGEVIWNFANGRDVSLVEPEPAANKGYGNSTTIPFDVRDGGTARLVLLSLAETIGRRLRKDRAKIEVVSVGIRFADFRYASHQSVLHYATDITGEIHKAAELLFEELWDGTAVRSLGIHTGRVSVGEERQLALFETTDYEKLQKLDRAVDSIRERFGVNAVQRASYVKQDRIRHMSGGVSNV